MTSGQLQFSRQFDGKRRQREKTFLPTVVCRIALQLKVFNLCKSSKDDEMCCCENFAIFESSNSEFLIKTLKKKKKYKTLHCVCNNKKDVQACHVNLKKRN